MTEGRDVPKYFNSKGVVFERTEQGDGYVYALAGFGDAFFGVRCFTASAGYLRFGPMVQCVVHALKGLACRARVTPAISPASHCQQCSALTPSSLHAHGCARPSRAR